MSRKLSRIVGSASLRSCRLGKTFTFGQLLLWTMSAGFLGVFYMPPMRKHMIVKQNLPFPSGTATAIVIARLHEAKSDGIRRARSLIIASSAAFIYVLIAYFIPVRAWAGKMTSVFEAASCLYL